MDSAPETQAPVDSLVTGGTGFLGRWLLARLTAQHRRVAVLVRGGESRREELASFVDGHGGDSTLLVLVDGDIGEADLRVHASSLSGVRDVFHLAAVFAFGMRADEAARVNVEGALRVAALAKGLPRLRRFVALGGYRATRLPSWLESAPDPLPSELLRRLYAEHGAYEASKLQAHRKLEAYAAEHGLPLTSVHPATVIGSSVNGETSQRTGLAETVERLWNGRMPALVGSSETFVPIISVDYLADFLASVPDNDETLGQDLVVLDAKTPVLPKFVEHISAYLGVQAPRKVLSKKLVGALPEFISGVQKETLTFLSEDRYDTRAAEAHARRAGLKMPDWKPSVERWLDYLVSTRFLRQEAERGRFVTCAGSQTYVSGDEGTADTLFLHGLPWDGESGVPLATVLEERFVYADLPGMGRSSSTELAYEGWLEALLAARPRPIRIIAHSLATGVALRYAQRHPERVSELVLVSPYFLQAPAKRWMRCAPVFGRVLRSGDAETFGARLLLRGCSSAPVAVTSAHAQLRRRGVAGNVARALADVSRPEEREALVSALAAIAPPVCLVHGAMDPLIVEQPKGASVVCIEGAGHNPHLEYPASVASSIRSWRTQRLISEGLRAVR